MGTKERLEILVGTQSKGKAQETINDLLKRIGSLEFEVERYENILDTLENHLLEIRDKYIDDESEKLWAIANQSMYIYNYIQKLKGSDK